ncbi:MFS transporter [Infirmifilum sp. NZ]|uniref:MFS transporter n=1 Tax=Infirmifilum sp. NZ TaxID=2926850 RepID=UPI0027996A99|nr:MFS transporter [Infirmifilum sp. NZ]UNQ72536.1 MFS transporter [Infirmifilum sp. NZ]
MRWSELPRSARYYILYHAMVAPLLFTWYMVPYDFLEEGYTVLELGILLTAVNVFSIPAKFLVGRYFTFHDVKKGLLLIDVLESTSLLLLYFATGSMVPLFVGVSLLVSNVAATLYPLYQAYERAVYPEDRMKEALVWHMSLPEAAAVLSYPFLGYVFGVLCPSLDCVRNGFLVFAAVDMMLALYILRFFQPVVLREEEENASILEDLKALVQVLRGKLRLYFAVNVLYLLAWRLVPTFVVVNYIVEEYGGNLFHVALLEASVSLATVASMFVVNEIPERHGFHTMMLSVIGAAIATLIFYAKPPFEILLLLGFAARMFDSAWFVFNRNWLFKTVSREEAALISAGVSALNSTMFLAMPLVTGTLAAISPSLPYLAGFLLMVSTLPLLLKASKTRKNG